MDNSAVALLGRVDSFSVSFGNWSCNIVRRFYSFCVSRART
jgi:hypothetical protein